MYLRCITATVLAMTTILAGCGGGAGGGGAEPTKEKPVEVKMGLVPISAVAPVYLGMDKGFFAAEGLKIKPSVSEGGAAVLPSVVSGDQQFGFSNPVSLILAGSKDLPVQIVANANSETRRRDDQLMNSFVFSSGKGDIRSARDLAGKTIAVNTLDNLGPVTIKAALEKQGVKTGGLKFVEVPFPDMLGALESGRVDAVWLVEPFTTAAKKTGARKLLRPYFDVEPGMTTSIYFASKNYADRNPKVVAAFQRAMKRSNAYAAAHPDELRSAIGESTKIPPPVLKQIALPYPDPKLNVGSLKRLAKLMVRFDFAKREPDFGTLVRN